MQCSDHRDNYLYIRECYPEYFDYVMDTLGSGKIKNVTARHVLQPLRSTLMGLIHVPTAFVGIGTSTFYVDFLLRYSVEYPDAIILLKSFSTERQLKKLAVCRYYYGTLYEESALGDPSYSLEDLYRKARNAQREVICFCDGVPDMILDQRMITFTSPDDKWYSYILKSGDHRPSYLPLWTPNELKGAARSLGLAITDHEIDIRIGLYGGMARVCLAAYKDIVKMHNREFKYTAKSVKRGDAPVH